MTSANLTLVTFLYETNIYETAEILSDYINSTIQFIIMTL